MFGRRPNPVFTPEYAQVRQVLTEARRAAGLSQRTLASRLGKASSHVSMIERGQRRVDVLEFYRLAGLLGRDPAELFSEVARRLQASAGGSPPAFRPHACRGRGRTRDRSG